MGETLSGPDGQVSELEVVYEDADHDEVQSSGWGLGTCGAISEMGAQEEEQVWGRS